MVDVVEEVEGVLLDDAEGKIVDGLLVLFFGLSFGLFFGLLTQVLGNNHFKRCQRRSLKDPTLSNS